MTTTSSRHHRDAAIELLDLAQSLRVHLGGQFRDELVASIYNEAREISSRVPSSVCQPVTQPCGR